MGRDQLVAILAVIHVGAGFVYVAGYVGTAVLTEIARRTDDAGTRRAAIDFSGLFDRRLVRVPGTVTGLAGLALTAAAGHPWLSGWVVAATIGYAFVIGLGIFFWARVGGGIEGALASGDDAEVARLLREPRFVAVSRVENVVLAAVIALMVLRPG
jgi:hypothetical protein